MWVRISQGLVDRLTRDLDYFGAPGFALSYFAPQIIGALVEDGLEVEAKRQAATFYRLAIKSADDETELDLAIDARLFPLVESYLGWVLSPLELATDKVLAIFGRVRLVDFEPLIDRETFTLAQHSIAKNGSHAQCRALDNSDFPLRRAVRCEPCQTPLTARWSTSRSGKKYSYNHCRNRLSYIECEDLACSLATSTLSEGVKSVHHFGCDPATIAAVSGNLSQYPRVDKPSDGIVGRGLHYGQFIPNV